MEGRIEQRARGIVSGDSSRRERRNGELEEFGGSKQNRVGGGHQQGGRHIGRTSARV